MGETGWMIVTILGLCLGIGLGFWLGRTQRGSDSAKLAEVEAELESYRARVTEHFTQSAAHFQAIGRQYRELYEHMASGSQALCEPSGSELPLRFPAPEAVAALDADEPREDEQAPAQRPVDYVSAEAEEARSERSSAGVDPEPAAQAGEEQGENLASASRKLAGDDAESDTDSEEAAQPAEVEPEPEKRLYH